MAHDRLTGDPPLPAWRPSPGPPGETSDAKRERITAELGQYLQGNLAQNAYGQAKRAGLARAGVRLAPLTVQRTRMDVRPRPTGTARPRQHRARRHVARSTSSADPGDSDPAGSSARHLANGGVA